MSQKKKESMHGRKQLTFYYKPRIAGTDVIVVNAWQELSSLPPPDTLLLPSYKIISYPDEKCSIWENIEGTPGKALDECAGNVLFYWIDNQHPPEKIRKDLEG